MNTRRVDTLTSLRFFAAVSIVVHHLKSSQLWIPQDAISHFGLGQQVSLFFVLSGYILHLNYRNSLKRIPAFHFIFLRFMRLWPAHLFAMLMVLILFSPWVITWFENNLTWSQILQVVFLVQAFNPDSRVGYAINVVSWSISAELFFYVLFPLLSRLVRRHGWRAIAGVGVLTLTYLVVAQALFDGHVFADAQALGYLNPCARVLEFTLGIWACEIAFRSDGRSRPWSFGWGSAVELTVLGIVIGTEYISMPVAAMAGQATGSVVSIYVASTLPFPTFAALIFVLHRQAGAVSALLRHPSLVRLGDWSFALYLLHYAIIQWFKTAVAPGTPLLGQIAMFCTVLLGGSAFVFTFVEQPTIAWAKLWLGWRRRPVLPSAMHADLPSATVLDPRERLLANR